MEYRPEEVEQADSEGQLPPHEHTRDLAQSSRGNSVFFLRRLWSLSCNKNLTGEQDVHNVYQSLQNFPVQGEIM